MSTLHTKHSEREREAHETPAAETPEQKTSKDAAVPDNSQEPGRQAVSVTANMPGTGQLMEGKPATLGDHFTGDKVPPWANEPGGTPPSELKGTPIHAPENHASAQHENHAPTTHETHEPPRGRR